MVEVLLGIESSCDETSVAAINRDGDVLELVTKTQLMRHREFGGVVPEWAARDHLAALPDICQHLYQQLDELGDWTIGAVAVTQGPGLVGGLMVGTTYAEALARTLDVPLYGVNHLEGHVLAATLTGPIEYPALVVLASGGHTQILLTTELGNYTLMAETVDDAIGEAFDKIARLLGLTYPGGPSIEKAAKAGDETSINLPRPLLHSRDGRLSMSGLKTAVINVIKEIGEDAIDDRVNDVAASFQACIRDVLNAKLNDALTQSVEPIRSLIFTGGVAANQYLRGGLATWCDSHTISFVVPPFEHCTDNAAMIAAAGLPRWLAGDAGDRGLVPKSRWPLA